MANFMQLKRVQILFVVLMLLWLIIEQVQDLLRRMEHPVQPETRSQDLPKVFPDRISFSERANLYTLEDENVIRQMKSMIQSLRIAGHPIPLDTRNNALDSLSSIIQKQLVKSLEVTSSDCNGPTLLCGHFDENCGFGCQIRHRMTCVALSYMMGFPLIHDEETGWRFRKKWREALQPIGSNCKIGINTINVSWAAGGPRMTKQRKCSLCDPEVVPSFIKNGFLVPKEIGELVEKLHSSPFLWWAGQFANFTLRLTRNQALLLDKAKLSIGLSSVVRPAFGIHIRRTDKITEAPDSLKDISSYFDQVKVFRNITNASTNFREDQIIFIASDDHTLLQKTREIYPTEKILGFPSTRTLSTATERLDALDDIIRDILILGESYYIVCGISSNVCRLLLELLSARHADILERFKFVEGTYYYHLYIFFIKENVIYESQV